MIRTPERTGEAARGECQRQHLAVELGHLGIRFHQRPRASLDLGQGLEDIRPRTAEGLHVTAATGDWNVSRDVGGRLRGRISR